MSRRRLPVDLAEEEAKWLVAQMCEQLRRGRYDSDQSQASAARNAGMSTSQYARLEGGRLEDPTFGQWIRAFQAVGLTTSLGHGPSGLDIRSARSVKLITKLESLSRANIHFDRDEGLPGKGDTRGWDAMLRLPGWEHRVMVDAEEELRDPLATRERMLEKLKADGRSKVMLLVVRNKWSNRTRLAAHRDLLAQDFPMESKRVLALLRRGVLPGRSGIVMLWNTPPAGNRRP